MFESAPSGDAPRRVAGKELSGKTTKSLWERVKSSRIGAFFFGGRERLIIDPKAQVKTDEQGRIVDISGNESGEVLSLILEVSGDDRNFWHEISNLTFEHAKEKDSDLEGRVQAITQRSLAALSSSGEYAGRDLSIKEGEIMLHWISRVNRALRKEREKKDVEDGAFSSSLEQVNNRQLIQEDSSTHSEVEESKEADRFQNSIIASTFFDDVAQYSKLSELSYEDIFSNDEYRQYQDRIVQTSLDLRKRSPMGRDLFAMNSKGETLSGWIERVSRLVSPSQMKWPLGKASELAQSLAGNDKERWEAIRDKRFSRILEEEKEKIFKLVEDDPSFWTQVDQNQTVEVILQKIAHLEK